MAKVSYKTEDQVRDGAKIILGFDKTEEKVQQGTGQITTFNQLGFKGVIDKPDGWYLPDDLNAPAIILETKSEAEDISLQKWVDELEKNCKLSKVISRSASTLWSCSRSQASASRFVGKPRFVDWCTLPCQSVKR